MTNHTVASLAAIVGGVVSGDGNRTITGISDLKFAGAGQIAFVRSRKYGELARNSKAGALIVPERFETAASQIVVDNVGAAFATVAGVFFPVPRATVHEIHASAFVDPSAELEAPVTIGPRVVVEAGARIGAGSVLHAGVIVREGSTVGQGCVLHSGVVLYPRVMLGARVILHGNCVLGGDGYGYAQKDGHYIKIPHVGGVLVGDDVEVGAGTVIDGGTFAPTRIGTGTKIDNLVHIGHNCVVGVHVAIAACCAFSGSTIIGDHAVIGGQVVSAGHLRVGDGVRIGGNSSLLHDVPEPGDYMGYPLMSKVRWIRTLHSMHDLVDLRRNAMQRGEIQGGRDRGPAPEDKGT